MSTELVLRNAVAAAVMAPSSHNTQPWRFRIVGHSLQLLADLARHLTVIDRDCRQLVESCGCALYNARVAVRAMGYDVDVDVNVVDHDLPVHLATLRLGSERSPTDHERALMSAIGRRSTNRRSFLARPVAPETMDQLIHAAAAEGVKLARLVPPQKEQLAKLVEEADERQFADPAYRKELQHWLAPRGSLRRDGIPFEEKEYGSTRPFAVTSAFRSPALGALFGMLEESLVRTAPAIVVLGTPTDDPPAWLATGQALEAILLNATASGLSAAFLNQMLEIPDLRASFAKLVPGIGYPQMILRIGVPAEPVERMAPRRHVSDVLVES